MGATSTRPPSSTTAPCLPASTGLLRRRRPHTGLYWGALITHVEAHMHMHIPHKSHRNTHVLHAFHIITPLRGWGGSRREEVSEAQETDWLPGCPWRQHMGEECVAGETLIQKQHVSVLVLTSTWVSSCYTVKYSFGLFLNFSCSSPWLPRRHGNRALWCHFP